MNNADAAYFKSLVRDIPDFPKKGIIFKDITTVLKDGRAFSSMVNLVAEEFRYSGITTVVGVEARGFVLGAAVAYALNCGIVPIRKKGKLPHKTYNVTYDLEYGTDSLEIHQDALHPKEKVLVVDDLLATGGTVAAAVELLKSLNAEIAGLAFFVELSFLKGREKLAPHPIYSVIQY